MENSDIDPRRPLLARFRAAGIHLGVSCTVALALIVMVTQVWYPAPLFVLANGRDIFLLLLGCDITLGPVMTLIIFNIRKPRTELLRDVAIIAFVQFAAMVYGVSTLLQARPAYIVYNVGQFNVPLANELFDEAVSVTDSQGKPAAAAHSEISAATRAAPWFGPKLVGARLPKDSEENHKLLFSALGGNGDVFQIPRYFVPYEEIQPDVVERVRDADAIARELRRPAEPIRAIVEKYRRDGVEVGLLPLRIRTTVALAVVDRRSGKFVGIAPMPPVDDAPMAQPAGNR